MKLRSGTSVNVTVDYWANVPDGEQLGEFVRRMKSLGYEVLEQDHEQRRVLVARST